MKPLKESMTGLLVMLISFGAFNSSTVYASEPDSTGVFSFNILEPAIAGAVPNSLRRVGSFSSEEDVAKVHETSSSLYLNSISTADAGNPDRTDFSVGQIPLNSSVSSTGARIYSIPVPVAAGWSATPQVSLCYNSQSGNGSAGYGWGISGISSIEIRNRNYYYDGEYRSAIYDSYDSDYSLDGVPIVASSSVIGDYDYSTARGNLQISKHFNSSGVLSHFTVLYPDGSRGTYGSPDNSGYKTTYPLTRLEDIDGNAIVFNYRTDGGHDFISSITYGKDACISFQYEWRRDSGTYMYRAGFGSRYPGLRMTSIVSKDGDVEICRYTLEYEYKDDVSLLRKIGCSSDGMSYAPLSFRYGVDSGNDDESAFSLKGQNWFRKYFTKTDDVDILYKRGKFIPGGYNDGMIMLPYFENYGKIGSKTHMLKRYYKYGSTYSKDQTILCNPSAVEHAYQFEIKAGEGFQTIEAVDVDGDGTDELVKINSSCTVQDNTDFMVYVYSFDRYGTASCDSMSFRVNDGTHNPCFKNPVQCDYYFGDFRGTGKKMLLIATRTQSRFALFDLDLKCKVSETSLFTMSDDAAGLTLAADFENDGQDDLCHITDKGMDVYSLSPITGTTFSLRTVYSGISRSLLFQDLEFTNNGAPAEIPGALHVLDVNGDGYMDIACAPCFHRKVDDDMEFNSSAWNISVFNGKKFSTQYSKVFTRLEGDEIIFMDVDRDGLPDMLHLQNSRLLVIPNVDGTFKRQVSDASVSIEENAELIPCDISAYGISGDIMTVSGPYVNVYDYGINHASNRLLTQLEDSFGVFHNDTYGDISRNDGAYLTDYSRSYDSRSGYMRKRLPVQVLLCADIISGNDCVMNEQYTYYDAVFNSRGLGFCGFGKTRCIDFVNGYVTCSELAPEKMGVAVRVSRALRSSSGSPFEETVNTYDDHSTSYGKMNPRLICSETVDHVSGITTVTEVTYDKYDYPTSTKTTKSSVSGAKHKETMTNVYEHDVSEEKYVLGVVMEKSVVEDDGSVVSNLSWKNKSVMTYDGHYHLLTRKDYVGDYGLSGPARPITDSLIIMMESMPELAVTTRHDATNLVSETEWTYDSCGNVTSEKTASYGASAFVGNTYTYDDDGRYLLSDTNPLGQTATYSGYNKFGKPACVTDYNGRTTSYTYDGWGNLIRSEHPDGTVEETVTKWGGRGLYTVSVNASGRPGTVVHYDASGREVRTGVLRFDSRWQYVDKTYDGKGRLHKESLPFIGTSASYWNEVEYDEFGRRIRLTEASGKQSEWTYDGTSVSSSMNGIESTRTYDADGHLISVSDAGGTITYTLRADGQPSSVTAPGNVKTLFSYDGYGRRIKIVDPSAGTVTDNVVYGSDGSSVSTRTNPNGSIITYADKYGRTVKIERPGEYDTEYRYAPDGLLVAEVSSNGTSSIYTYDAFDRVVSLQEAVPDGKWLKKTLTYAADGNVESVSYESQDGFIATENFIYLNGINIGSELDGTLVRLVNGENEFGQPRSVSTGGMTRTYSYDAFGMPTRRTMGSVMDCSYHFDPLTGNLLGRRDNLHRRTETFGYDALNRLTAIDGRVVTYSDNGNVTGIDAVGTMAYGNGSKPYQVTSLTLEDEVAPSTVQNISYTCYSRPSIIREGGRSAAFTYNGDGDRVKMNVSDGTASVLSRYYIGDRYELDVTPAGMTERLYLGGDAYSAPAVYVRDGAGEWTFYNIGRDYLGNITHIATSDGTLVEENSYDPWGRLRNLETGEIYAPGTEPELMLGRGYTGHEHLTWFGLINMNARLYDPVLGRFLSPDPFVQIPDFTQSFNRYSYCLNNPLVYVDENGEFVITTAIIVGICVTAVIGAAIGTYEGYKIAEKKDLHGANRVLTMIGGGLIGGVAGGVSSLAGAYVGAGMAAAGVGGFCSGAAVGGTAGAAAGMINGFGMAMLETGDPLYGLKQGALQASVGAISGGLIGGLIGGVSSAIKGNDFLNGHAPASEANLTPYEKGRQGVERAIEAVRTQGGDVRGREVTIRVNGTKVRVDFVTVSDEVTMPGEKMTFYEVKNGPHAGFTSNQKIVYPEMLLNKPVVYPVGEVAKSIFKDPLNNYNFVIIKFNF